MARRQKGVKDTGKKQEQIYYLFLLFFLSSSIIGIWINLRETHLEEVLFFNINVELEHEQPEPQP